MTLYGEHEYAHVICEYNKHDKTLYDEHEYVHVICEYNKQDMTLR